MRVHSLVFAMLALAAASASAQAPSGAQAPAAAAPMKTFVSSSEIAALVDKAKAERKPNQPLVVEPILLLAPYRAQIEYRPARAPAAVHEKDAELMYVLEGEGNIVTGGKLVDEKRTNAANLTGTSIEGGHSQAVKPGDYVFVPQSTPHQVEPTGGAAIVLVTMHVPRPVDWN
jgi:mannose-6-phosphate isomerase-like protein (cupin superfamily)